ncbi:tRNA (N(6)-L-threonylcarbamoyladenosine(37)-C(2))-methylthiotransferase MtaB [Trichlorobacter ammonificans]|uniref:MiaB family protein, possibly involved in tRNA or rRNA modification n=1 Tax=Trichlorobacter ammonificans TaxID=2916410 RepID=A0ABM9D6A5_9BACT|nr:tRNA (N(6)-L-threonylcarbamoyladenosine(37)-C(2))-methylthiotransferase MtaB [Trichlorobacter ammonificans]CAH2030781.1 MiaB family protein, possibly involved in tRNA or rRNA modification [Trichlorobacter ammonificans]
MQQTDRLKTFAIATLGCKVNQFESADMIEQLRNAGWKQVSFNEAADLYLVNSCTVTGKSDAESRKLLRRARRANPDATVVATGCYAQVSPEALQALAEVDQVLGNREKVDILRHITLGADQVSSLTEQLEGPSLKLTSFADHTRAFLQIQSGCENGCSYCIVPIARGPNRSVAVTDVEEAVRRLAGEGYREVVLTGIHLGAYQSGLTGLLRRLDATGAVERLRLGSLEPNELSDELLELIAGSSRICPHLHLPLQSGSDTVLHRMRRRYDAALYRQVVEKVAQRLPDAFLAADVIAGFPGETEQEFRETCDLIAALPLADLHVFPYSRRPGTVAAAMPDQLPPAVIKERTTILNRLAAVKLKLFRQRFIGSHLEVLGQRHDPATGLISGLSRNYLEIDCPGTADDINRLRMVRVTALSRNRLVGEPA